MSRLQSRAGCQDLRAARSPHAGLQVCRGEYDERSISTRTPTNHHLQCSHVETAFAGWPKRFLWVTHCLHGSGDDEGLTRRLAHWMDRWEPESPVVAGLQPMTSQLGDLWSQQSRPVRRASHGGAWTPNSADVSDCKSKIITVDSSVYNPVDCDSCRNWSGVAEGKLRRCGGELFGFDQLCRLTVSPT